MISFIGFSSSQDESQATAVESWVIKSCETGRAMCEEHVKRIINGDLEKLDVAVAACVELSDAEPLADVVEERL